MRSSDFSKHENGSRHLREELDEPEVMRKQMDGDVSHEEVRVEKKGDVDELEDRDRGKRAG